MKWEFLKDKCRDLSRKISIEKSRERKSRRVELENRSAELLKCRQGMCEGEYRASSNGNERSI